MRHLILAAIFCLGILFPLANQAQSVDRTKYPDYTTCVHPDYSLLENNQKNQISLLKGINATELPDHVDNSSQKFFPPIFNQDGGSCGSASRICYMFTHEINSYRNVDAQSLSNRYPSHFVWLLTFGNSGKEDFAINVGIPSAEVYGGITYSQLFGNQNADQNNFGWMQGYDKWFAAMNNRMSSTATFPISIGTKEGREALKRWLYNHNGDNDFQCGGVAGIGVASAGGDWRPIPTSLQNNNIGATGKKFVSRWGTQVDHALTIVGYDDRIEFDLNGNGILGEESADERGAWIMANSWGSSWCNNGFIYCPYAYAGPTFNTDGKFSGEFWMPEIYRVRKNYRPLRTIKVKMDYSRRSEIKLSAGISSDIYANSPEKVVFFDHFKYAGDGNSGKTNPAPEVPMLGRWADGKLHTEPMEFGYDLTDLSSDFDKSGALKYFFIIETRNWAIGKGKIYDASIIDYEFERNGIEIPFDLHNNGIEIQNQGNKTIISTIVYGESYYAPQNLTLANNTLSWNAPVNSIHPLKGYKIYKNNEFIAEIPLSQISYSLSQQESGSTYQVSALYQDGIESAKISVCAPIVLPQTNQVIDLKHSGISIPNIFTEKFNETTIEYWLNPHSIRDWNQSGGPGWGTFMFHANANGSFTAGWTTGEHRTQTGGRKLRNNIWTHVAITVKDNTMKIFINGEESASVTSDSYNGIGGFGDLVFNPNGDINNTDAKMDEIRIWNYARNAQEIRDNKNNEFAGSILPKGLIAYYKGDIINTDGKSMLHEYIGQNHAEILNYNYTQSNEYQLNLHEPQEAMSLDILPPSSSVYKGIPVKLRVIHSNSINRLEWTAEGAGIRQLAVTSPSFTFQKTGLQTITVKGISNSGKSIEKSITVQVENMPEGNANFTATQTLLAAGERVSFITVEPLIGYSYIWDMPGAETEKGSGINASAVYPEKGTYTITLSVISPDGRINSSSQDITVKEAAPDADFAIHPAIIIKGDTTQLEDKSKHSPTQWQWIVKNGTNDIIINRKNYVLTPQHTGVYDVALTVQNAMGSDTKLQKRGLIVCNADSKNGINFSHPNAQIKLSKVPFEKGINRATIEWWMNPTTLSNYCNGLGEANIFEVKTSSTGAMVFSMGNEHADSYADFVKVGEWHHYAIVFDYGNIVFYKDGKRINSSGVTQYEIPSLNNFFIGFDNAPMNGQIDEFRIWNSALTEEDLASYANSPIYDIDKATKEKKLLLYYDFNQNNGYVIDRTSHHNDGQRINFGPEGDAWGLSQGVFCLNFEPKVPDKDITSKYLKNYKKAFKRDGDKLVNEAQNPRFGAIADWTLEKTSTLNGITTGVHVDNQKEACFTFSAGHDGFGELTDHKVYQTIILPPGSYNFIIHYGDYEKQCGNSHIVVAKGRGLPDTENLNTAIASAQMNPEGYFNVTNTLSFILNDYTEVSIGLVINLSGYQCCAISEFQLLLTNTDVITEKEENGFDLTIDENGYNTVYLPYPVEVPTDITVYVATSIQEDLLIMEKLENNIIPAETGVIVTALPGNYHLIPTITSSTISSILFGVLADGHKDPNKQYYQLDASTKPGFYPVVENILKANHAYVITDVLPNATDFYRLKIETVGIEQPKIESRKTKTIYDLYGRRITNPTKGIYIVNGQKTYIE